MPSVPQSRQFAYAVSSTLVPFVAWVQWFQSSDGALVLWAAVGLFVLAVALDWTLQRQLRADRDAAA
ncbi:hypothetical protein [Salinarchaeum sp. Harcht-Bsk1]|uniref:hypothetical protein n=1 Tax=Salinarchaeum sp. Harcht-Bsk1 TaxID=1333523 RepID=UPI000677B265|nr:hypothetical protein [Salinarchaeum sp. Harcht-Bsk1]